MNNRCARWGAQEPRCTTWPSDRSIRRFGRRCPYWPIPTCSIIAPSWPSCVVPFCFLLSPKTGGGGAGRSTLMNARRELGSLLRHRRRRARSRAARSAPISSSPIRTAGEIVPRRQRDRRRSAADRRRPIRTGGRVPRPGPDRRSSSASPPPISTCGPRRCDSPKAVPARRGGVGRISVDQRRRQISPASIIQQERHHQPVRLLAPAGGGFVRAAQRILQSASMPHGSSISGARCAGRSKAADAEVDQAADQRRDALVSALAELARDYI